MVANFQEMRSLVDSILAQVGNEDAKVEDVKTLETNANVNLF